MSSRPKPKPPQKPRPPARNWQTAIFFIAFCRPSRGPRAYEPKSTALSLSAWPTIGRHALDVTP